MPTHVRIESAGKRSTALCEQISSVDVSRLGDFKGHLTDREMAQVDVASWLLLTCTRFRVRRK